MTRTMPHTDPEEARKELVATIHAGRDLGPEMDDALVDRFIDRLRTLKPEGFDQKKTRADLETLLNSSRGSDPAGDEALADSFLEGIRPAVPASAPAMYGYSGYPAPQPYGYGGPPAPASRSGFSQVAPLVVIGTIAVVALIVSRGEALWFMWFLIPMLIGYGRRNQYRRSYRDQRRAYRHNRMLGPDDVYRPLPPSGPPEIL